MAGDSYYAGRSAVVTGAASGIGRALSRELAARGCRLALWDRDRAGLELTATDCAAYGVKVRTDVVDVTDAAVLRQAASAAKDHLGSVDLGFCVAGVIHTGTLLGSDPEDLERVIHTNVCGTLNTVSALLPLLIESGRGHLVTTSSGFGVLAAGRYAAYCASKFAIVALTDSLRQELAAAGHPVRATCVVPGGVRTPIMHNGSYAGDVEAAAVIHSFDTKVARTSAEDAAATILRELPRGRRQILVGADAKLANGVARVFGGSYYRLMPWLIRTQRTGTQAS